MEEENITVHALRDFNYLGETIAEGAVIELPRPAALEPIENGDAKPVFCETEFVPPIPLKGCSLSEARLAHLDGYPGLHLLFDRLDLPYDNGPINTRTYAKPPIWEGVQPDIVHDLSLRDSERHWENRGGGGERYLRRPIEPFGARFDNALVPKLWAAANHSFISLFKEEKLIAYGVAEDDLKTLERHRIPARWFRRDTVLNGANEILENVNSNPAALVRRWSDLIVYASTAENPEEDRPAGRPDKLKEALLNQFADRVDQGKVRYRLTAEATALHQWAVENYPEDDVPAIGSIENLIRARHKANKASIKQKPTKI